jgi:glycosyltransferase involved in cell wall biosynthesis
VVIPQGGPPRVRVAMVGLRAPWGPEGGVERAVAELAPRLVERGIDVTVFCRRRYNARGEGVFEGVRLRDHGTIYTKRLEAIVHTVIATPQAALGHDVVHFHATGPAMLSWMPRLLRTRTVVTVHGLDWQREKWGPGARLALKAGAWCAAHVPDRVITVAEHLREHYREHYGVDAICIPNGVSPIVRRSLEEADVEGLEARGYYLFLGRLVPEKGLDLLIDAALHGSTPLVIAGSAGTDHAYEAKLRARASPLVRFVGPRFGAMRDALLSNARALVLASSVEGLPLTPLEALAAGTPVLLSDIAPHREILAGVDAGALVAPDAWTATLRSFAKVPTEELEKLGQRGEAHVRTAFSWDAAADRTAACYRDVVSLV